MTPEPDCLSNCRAGKEGNPVGGGLTVATLTSDQANALAKLGVTSSYNLLTNANDATWTVTDTNAVNTYGSTNTAKAVTITPTLAAQTWPNLASTNGIFVIFGLGSFSSAVGPGRLMQEAPTICDNADMEPASNYQRFGVVFEIAADNTANYVGAVSIHDDGIASSEAELQEYHSIQQ